MREPADKANTFAPYGTAHARVADVTIAVALPSPAVPEDGDLLQRLAKQDPDALGELYDRYGRVVLGVLHQMLPSPEAAEEVCQDAFHKVWKAAATYRGDRGAVRTWLLAIARNAAVDWRRTKGRRIERESALDLAHRLASPHSVEETVANRLRGQELVRLIETLPAEQRECLRLAYWGGLTQSEIAKRTGAPLGTVKSRVRMAMERLRTLTPVES